MALVVAGAIGASLVAVLLRQARTYSLGDDVVHAQQSLRAAADLLSTELRQVGPGDLFAATPDSVSLRRDVLRAVVCASDGAGRGAATLFVYDSVHALNLPPGTRGWAFSDPGSATWRRVEWADPGSSPLSVETDVGRRECEERGAPAGLAGWRYRRVEGWLETGGFGSVPEPGAVVVGYGRLTYRLAPSSFDEAGVALWRNRQELLSPFGRETRFVYRLADGTARRSVAPAELGSVRLVGLRGTALGKGGNRHRVARPLRFDVPLPGRR